MKGLKYGHYILYGVSRIHKNCILDIISDVIDRPLYINLFIKSIYHIQCINNAHCKLAVSIIDTLGLVFRVFYCLELEKGI